GTHGQGFVHLRYSFRGKCPATPEDSSMVGYASGMWVSEPARAGRATGKWTGGGKRPPPRVGKALPKLIDLLLEGLQPLLMRLHEGQDRRLGGRRYLAPQFYRDRRNGRHTSILRPLEARTSSAADRLQ